MLPVKTVAYFTLYSMDWSDVEKANLLLLLTALVFIVLVIVAFLFTEGRPVLIFPVLKRIYPGAEPLKQYELEERDKIFILMTQHFYGKKRTRTENFASCDRNGTRKNGNR